MPLNFTCILCMQVVLLLLAIQCICIMHVTHLRTALYISTNFVLISQASHPEQVYSTERSRPGCTWYLWHWEYCLKGIHPSIHQPIFSATKLSAVVDVIKFCSVLETSPYFLSCVQSFGTQHNVLSFFAEAVTEMSVNEIDDGPMVALWGPV